MSLRFNGTPIELKALIEAAGITGRWAEDGQGKTEFRSLQGGVLNWWSRTGTVNCQGNQVAKAALESALAAPGSGGAASVSSSGRGSRQIFVVHGHDTGTRDQLELALRRLGLEPYVLMNTSGGGQTLIEALEGKIGKNYSSDFGIVLMTPDDIGYSKRDGADRAEPRARQNVILETGMLLSSLTRERIAIVVKGYVELPSDLEGIIHYGFNDHVREIIPKLCQRLQELGFDIRPEQISAATQ